MSVLNSNLACITPSSIAGSSQPLQLAVGLVVHVEMSSTVMLSNLAGQRPSTGCFGITASRQTSNKVPYCVHISGSMHNRPNLLVSHTTASDLAVCYIEPSVLYSATATGVKKLPLHIKVCYCIKSGKAAASQKEDR